MARVFNQERFLTALLAFSDGAFGNPRQRRVILHLSGGPQQFHTVTGEPISEGEMNGLCISTVFRSCLVGLLAWSFTCEFERPLHVSTSVWAVFVFAGAYPEMPPTWSLQKAHGPRAALQPCSVRSASAETSGRALYRQPPPWVLAGSAKPVTKNLVCKRTHVRGPLTYSTNVMLMFRHDSWECPGGDHKEPGPKPGHCWNQRGRSAQVRIRQIFILLQQWQSQI